MSRRTAIPTSRASRLFRFGKIASGMAGGALKEGVKRLASGDLPSVSDLLLTPSNAHSVANQLAEMRGAVMKIGQLLSMEAGELLPQELTDILSKLRDNAHSMPKQDIDNILQTAWGENWRNHFQHFNDEAYAAASIGQVHEAIDQSGRHLAVKIQYPGIAKSIDSDVDNAASLLKIFHLIPAGLEIEPLLQTAKRQLHDEANYELEAQHLTHYQQQLAADELFQLPQVIDEFSCHNVLTMTFVEGQGIEELVREQAPVRDMVATKLVELALKEFLHWGMVQTDGNFANYRFNANSGVIGLLDFGALHIHQQGRPDVFANLLRAAMERDMAKIIDTASEVGYIKKDDPFNYRMAMADLIVTAAEPAQVDRSYDFARSTLSQRLTEKLYRIRTQQKFQRLPPADVIFLHRKLAGVYLLCAKIKARVNVHQSIQSVLAQRDTETAGADDDQEQMSALAAVS